MDETLERAVVGKVTRRLIPFMFVLYVISYLDRINVGFAALQMNQELGFDSAVYGLGAGIFFLGYFLFEVPSNLILERVGARFWIARIMITWGIIAAAMMWVTHPLTFYLLRFLLGVAEAGFFPGMILYLTYWIPAAERARAAALFMTGTAIAGVIGGPLSGALLSMHGFAGLSGWQWLFLLEGVPAVILGIAVVFYLTDRPEHAHWLAPEERAWLSARLSQEREETQRQEHYTLKHALTAGRVWVLCVVYFGLVIGLYGFSLWLPQIVKSLSGLNDLGVGVVSAVPYLIAAIGMVLIGQHSDRTGERRWHVAASMFVAAVGLALSAFLETPVIALVLLSVGALGIWGALGPFWTLPTAFLSGTAAAGGIALINSVGNLGGFVGPSVVGFLENATGTFKGGLLALALALLVGGLLALTVGRKAAPTPAGARGG